MFYYFTLKLLGHLNLTPKVIYIDTQKKLCNIPKSYYDNNILKDNENTLLNNQSDSSSFKQDEQNKPLTPKQMAKIAIEKFSNNPSFAKIISDLKAKYAI